MRKTDTPGVIAPPPLVYLTGLAGGLVLDALVSWPGMAPQVWPGLVLLAGGILINLLGLREFRKAKTDYVPYRPTTRIITAGPFRFTRNPLYLGLALFYAGLALVLGSFWALVLLVPVLAVIRYGVIAREERYLEAKFGEEYRRYRSSVRRWI